MEFVARPSSRASSRTVRVGERDIYVVEMGEGRPSSCCTAAGPAPAECPTLPGTPPCSPVFPSDRSRHAGLRPINQGRRPERPVRRPRPRQCSAFSTRSNVGKAHLLGNSLGGAAALRLAIEAPDRVDRLVLLGPGGIDTSRRPPTEGLIHLLDYYSGEGPTREKCEAVPAQGPGVRWRGAA